MAHPVMTRRVAGVRRFGDQAAARATGLGAIWLLTTPLVLRAQEEGGSTMSSFRVLRSEFLEVRSTISRQRAFFGTSAGADEERAAPEACAVAADTT